MQNVVFQHKWTHSNAFLQKMHVDPHADVDAPSALGADGAPSALGADEDWWAMGPMGHGTGNR